MVGSLLLMAQTSLAQGTKRTPDAPGVANPRFGPVFLKFVESRRQQVIAINKQAGTKAQIPLGAPAL